MRIALGLPSRVVAASGEMMLEWAKRAEQGPFSSLSSPIVWFPKPSNPSRSSPWQRAPPNASV